MWAHGELLSWQLRYLKNGPADKGGAANDEPVDEGERQDLDPAERSAQEHGAAIRIEEYPADSCPKPPLGRMLAAGLPSCHLAGPILLHGLSPLTQSVPEIYKEKM